MAAPAGTRFGVPPRKSDVHRPGRVPQKTPQGDTPDRATQEQDSGSHQFDALGNE